MKEMSYHAGTSRPKPPPAGEEEVGTELKLGEFENADTLTPSEANLVINALMAKRKKENKSINNTTVLAQTIDYLDTFSRYRKKETVEAVEQLLSGHHELTKFEKAQLGSLCCAKAEEAKTLIPSLEGKISDDDLQELLSEMDRLFEQQ